MDIFQADWSGSINSFVLVGRKAPSFLPAIAHDSFHFPEATCSSLPRGPYGKLTTWISDPVVFYSKS